MVKLEKGKNDLVSLFPNLMDEWDYENNPQYDPEKMYKNGSQIINWKCKRGHTWPAKIHVRTRRNSPCPYCTGIYAIPGETDLQKLYPDIAAEWDYEKNTETPDHILPKSGKSVFWKCKEGHTWTAVVENRVLEQTGCPNCKGESQTSFPEQCIYYYLSQCVETVNRYSELGFEIDVYIPSLKLGIEYDGHYFHKNKSAKSREKEKNRKASKQGIELYRIKECLKRLEDNDKVFYVKNDHNKYDRLKKIIQEFLCIISKKTGCKYKVDIDISRDRVKIWEQYRFWIRENSLKALYPNVAQEWYQEKNGKLTPDNVSAHTNDKVWWICKKGHYWDAAVSKRTDNNNPTGCPYCSNQKVWKGYNDLASQVPELLDEWDYQKNRLLPEEVIYTSPKKYNWICKKCGYKYPQSLYKRVKEGQGCSACAGKNLFKGSNDFEYKFPELAKEWDYQKNNIKPSDVLAHSSSKKYYWICNNCGSSYKETPAKRADGRGCNICVKERRVKSRHDNIIKKGNSLYDWYPDIAEEWNYSANGDLTPYNVTYSQNIKVSWVCKKNSKHIWDAYVNNRTRKEKPQGCPFCSGSRAFPGETDFVTTHKEIALDWDYNKNTIDPTTIKAGCDATVFWKCHICQYEWPAKVCARTRGRYKCKNCKK